MVRKLFKLLARIDRWISDHTFVDCAVCHGGLMRKDAIYERTTTGQTAPLCEGYHRQLYGPFPREYE